MGLFSSSNNNKFVSNGKLVEFINTSTDYKRLEDEIEKRLLYRNVETVLPKGESASVIIKYKDLKVRSEMEVKMMREKMRKEAGLDIER